MGRLNTPPYAARATGRCAIRSESLNELRSLRSAPTQNAFGLVLVTTTTRTSGSADSLAQALLSSRAICVETAFIDSGRSSVSSAIWPPGPCLVIVTIGRVGAFRSLINPDLLWSSCRPARQCHHCLLYTSDAADE